MSSASSSRSACRSSRVDSARSERSQAKVTSRARIRVGTSPIPQATAPPARWSASRSTAHGRCRPSKKLGASKVVPLVSATPKKAWEEMVPNRMTSSSTGGQRLGPGSTPTSTQAKRHPASRKCAVISTCPVCVRSASSNRGE